MVKVLDKAEFERMLSPSYRVTYWVEGKLLSRSGFPSFQAAIAYAADQEFRKSEGHFSTAGVYDPRGEQLPISLLELQAIVRLAYKLSA